MTVYLFCAGGSAGHINPMLAVANAIKAARPDDQILCLGGRSALEARLIPRAGYELLTIPKLVLPRRINGQSLAFPLRFWELAGRVRKIIRQRSVEAVVGFGGYISAPAYLAARLEKIPLIVHEANAKAGWANILGSWLTGYVGVSYPGAIKKGRLIGTPLRPSIVSLDRTSMRKEALDRLGLERDRPVLLIVGGSQGAASLNALARGMARGVIDMGWQILHITGGARESPPLELAGYRSIDYLEDMDLALAAADMVITRSGAATVGEIQAAGLAALFVPYPVGNGEQEHNVTSLVEKKGALRLADRDLGVDKVMGILLPFMQDASRRQALAEVCYRSRITGGTQNMVAMIDQALFQSRDRGLS